MQSKQIISIQIARGVAALMVVAFHLMAIEQKYTSYNLLSGWAEYGKHGVDIFFIISGFIIAWTTKQQGTALNDSLQFLWRRAMRIYPLYWIFTTAVLLVWLLRPEMVNSSFTQPPGIMASYLLLPQETAPLLAVGWSLVFEMYFYLAFAMLLLLPRKYLPILLCAWGGVILLNAGRSVGPATEVLSSYLCLEFIAGALVGCVNWNFKPKNSASFAVLIGDASYAIYLSHVLVISVLGRLWAVMGMESLGLHLFWLAFCMLAAAVFGLLTHLWIERPLMRLVKKSQNKASTTPCQHPPLPCPGTK
jgi:exopolysaccharide production protein ExoZ